MDMKMHLMVGKIELKLILIKSFENIKSSFRPYITQGEGNVLAHAFYPTDGRLHFDDDETWIVSSNEVGIHTNW